MALVLADRVKETSTTTGTGTLTLAGAATGFRSFSVIGNGNTCYYTITNQTVPSEWEVGIGTYTLAGTTLARTTILASSNAGAVVTLSAGTKDVFVTYPAGRAVYGDGVVLAAPSGALLPVANGGTGVATLAGVAYGNGTSAFTAATGAQIATAIGATAVTNATNQSGGTVNATTGSFSGLLIGASSASTDVNTANDAGSFSARGSGTTIASMSFHRTGAYAINMGLGTDNVFRIGGWSASNNCMQLTGTGALTALSSVTAPVVTASNGIYQNATTISANYTIGAGNNALSAGPITISAGVVVTVPSGSVWVVV